MKSLIFTLVLGLVSTAALAADPENVFTGSSTWTNSSSNSFGEIDSEGIIMDALQKAQKLCESKYDLCVVKAITLDGASNQPYGGGRDTSYTVVMQGFNSSKTHQAAEHFRGTSNTWNSGQQGTLEILATEYGALANALKDCYSAGYNLCAIAGTNLTEANSYHGDDNSYHASAAATVLGIR